MTSNFLSRHVWQRLEALALSFVVGAYLFQTGAFTQYELPFLIWLLLWPDLAFIGYTLGTRVGAHFYNLVHSFAVPLILFLLWMRFGRGQDELNYLLFWMLHIGIDRALGFSIREINELE